jgi:hypothetical protein
MKRLYEVGSLCHLHKPRCACGRGQPRWSEVHLVTSLAPNAMDDAFRESVGVEYDRG